MDATSRAQMWLNDPGVDEQTKEQIRTALREDPGRIEECFGGELQFGTAGMRAVVGWGSLRLNRYTLGRAIQGLALLLRERGEEAMGRGVVIAYDTRRHSRELAQEAALILCGNGIAAHLFASPRPTPQLSFAVRELGASGGIMITASHNPPEYNGFKVYNSQGAQLASDEARELEQYLSQVPTAGHIRRLGRQEAEKQGLLRLVGQEMDERYLERLQGLSRLTGEAAAQARELRLVYTPLHGTGTSLVPQLLQRCGFDQVLLVEEQAVADPGFSTVSTPNPEVASAFEKALRLAKEEGAELILANDPDADRLGVMTPDDRGQWVPLSGNQLGALLLEHELYTRQVPESQREQLVLLTTVVSGGLAKAMAHAQGVEVRETLTGFKYIAQQMERLEQEGKQFLLGFEESLGFLLAPFVRDKDGLMAALKVAEMAAWHRSQGRTLWQALQRLSDRYGHYREETLSLSREGRAGQEAIRRITRGALDTPWQQVGPWQVVAIQDYSRQKLRYPLSGEVQELGFPQEPGIKVLLENGAWFCLRPSGTEPKVKLYLSATGRTAGEAEGILDRLREELLARIQRWEAG